MSAQDRRACHGPRTGIWTCEQHTRDSRGYASPKSEGTSAVCSVMGKKRAASVTYGLCARAELLS